VAGVARVGKFQNARTLCASTTKQIRSAITVQTNNKQTRDAQRDLIISDDHGVIVMAA